MASKIQLLEIYTIVNINDYENKDDYIINEETNHNQNWGRNMLLQNFCILN
jgi:hypothetical protein